MTLQLKILHISDLHFSQKDRIDRQIVIEAFFKDILALRDKGHSFDLVAFSGDLVNEGSLKVNFDCVKVEFLDQLLAKANIGLDRLILVPGNHDIDAEENPSYVEAGLRSELVNREKINAFIEDALGKKTWATEAALSRTEKYENFHASLGLGPFVTNNVFFKTQVVLIRGHRIGIAALNSAWRATGKPGDRHHLIIGERAVDLAIRDLEEAKVDFKICVFHHPMDWLLDADALAIESRIYNAFDLVCIGHVHRTLPEYRQTTAGAAILSQTGTLFANRHQHFNGFQIIDWDDATLKVHFIIRSYQDRRREFAPAENIIDSGLFEVDLKPRNTKDVSEVELVLRNARPAIRANADEQVSFATANGDTSRASINEVFVCQPLTTRVASEKMQEHDPQPISTDRAVTVEEILKKSNPVVILGDSETGRTSLAHYLAVRVADGVCDTPRIPCIVNMSLIVQASTYERQLRSYYKDSDIGSAEFANASRQLPWIVFVDDFDGANVRHVASLKEAVAEYPKHRFVVISTETSRRVAEDALGGGTTIVDIGFLSRSHIRLLSKSRSSKSLKRNEDEAYSLVIRHLNDSGLPRTGYMVTLLLWAAEQRRLLEHINEAVLLENLISYLLGKTNLEAAVRNKFDPRAQELLLRSIATEMRERGGWMKANELLQFVLSYFDRRGLQFGARQVLDELINCRLLIERDESIAFRYSCYQEYFCALDMQHSSEHLQRVLGSTSEKLVGYGRELDLWSSLVRETRGAEEGLIKIVRMAAAQLGQENRGLETIEFIGQELMFRRARLRQILANPMSKDQIDQVLDQIDDARRPAPSSGRTPRIGAQKKVTDNEVEITNDAETISHRLELQRNALQILTRITRNVDHELIEKKSTLAATLLRAWNEHVASLIRACDGIVNERKEEVISKSSLKSGDLDKILNLLRIMGPASDAGDVASILSVPSLRPTLLKITTDDSLPEGERYFAAICYCEGWDSDAIAFMKEFFRHVESKVLRRAVLQKMVTDFSLQKCAPQTADKFAALIADCEIGLGAPKENKSSRLLELARASDDRRV